MPSSNFIVLKSSSCESIASEALWQTRSATSPPSVALSRFARRSVKCISAHYRKRCSTRLFQATQTARPSRRLLSPAQPGSRRAGHAVCLRLWWFGRFRIRMAQPQQPIDAFQKLPGPSVSTARRLFSLFGFMRFPTARISDSEARRFTPQLSGFGVVAESLSRSEMTPNHALQRTAVLSVSVSGGGLGPTGSVTACATRREAPAHAAPSPCAAVLTAPASTPPSLSLWSLGVLRPLFRE